MDLFQATAMQGKDGDRMNKAFEKNLEIEKIKVASAEIVVHGTSEKPYYEIRYYDISDGKYHIGYSSYDLSIVFGWLKECFEIVQEVAGEYNNGWITCRDRLPEEGEDVLVWYEYFRYGNFNCMYQTYGIGYHYDGHWGGDVSGTNAKCIAWQPLPEPFKERD